MTTVAWDGTTDAGATVPDGVYRVSIRTLDWAGNGPGTSWDVVVDSRAPAVTLDQLQASISPNGDGAGDRATIAWTSDEPVRGQVRMLRGTTVVRAWKQASARSGSFAWDGTDAQGAAARDGRYVVEAELTDASGNRVVQRQAVTVDRTAGKLRWAPTALLPDGDRLAEEAGVSFRLTREATTSLRIEDATGRVVRNAWKDKARDAAAITWTWDGRDGHRDLVAPGRYVAVLSVLSKLGASELRRTVTVDAFVVTLSADDPAAGDALTLTIRSVESLRAAPTVTLNQTGLAPVKVKATQTGPGTYTATLTVAAGPGPVTLVIAARDTGGGTNVTRLAAAIQ
jgi:flagellar hook assembly protein FlgD